MSGFSFLHQIIRKLETRRYLNIEHWRLDVLSLIDPKQFDEKNIRALSIEATKYFSALLRKDLQYFGSAWEKRVKYVYKKFRLICNNIPQTVYLSGIAFQSLCNAQSTRIDCRRDFNQYRPTINMFTYEIVPPAEEIHEDTQDIEIETQIEEPKVELTSHDDSYQYADSPISDESQSDEEKISSVPSIESLTIIENPSTPTIDNVVISNDESSANAVQHPPIRRKVIFDKEDNLDSTSSESSSEDVFEPIDRTQKLIKKQESKRVKSIEKKPKKSPLSESDVNRFLSALSNIHDSKVAKQMIKIISKHQPDIKFNNSEPEVLIDDLSISCKMDLISFLKRVYDERNMEYPTV